MTAMGSGSGLGSGWKLSKARTAVLPPTSMCADAERWRCVCSTPSPEPRAP